MFIPTHLKSLQALELAVRCGSLKGAADRLALTPAAVGQRVKAIEEYLGIELVVRGRSGLRPSPALETAMAHLSAGFRELEAVADILDMQRGLDIHIAAPSDFAELWLQRRLPQFQRENPNIRFCVNGEGDAPIRLAPVDCEITFSPKRAQNDAEGVIALFPDFVLPLCSPENSRRILKAPKRSRLEGFPLLHLDFYREDPAVPNWPRWIKHQHLKRTAPERGIRFKRIQPAIEAVNTHAGITLCGLVLLEPLIEKDRVSMPFALSTGTWTQHMYQARFRADALIRPQVRRFKEWLRTEGELTHRWLQKQVKRRAATRTG